MNHARFDALKPRPQQGIAAQCLPDEGFVHVEIAFYWAQTFVAQRSGLLTRAVFELLWNEKADAAFEAALRSVDTRGFPASGNLAGQDLPPVPENRTLEAQALTVTFDNPARVEAGERYALALFSSEGILPNNRLGDPCAGGTAFIYNEAADEWAIQNVDLRFAAYVKA